MLSLDDQLTARLERVLGPEGEGLPEGSLRWGLPKDASFGDLACSVAFKLTRTRRQAPQAIAESLIQALQSEIESTGLSVWIDRVEARAGFLNAFFSAHALQETVRDILKKRRQFGCGKAPKPRNLNIEFVSANPTGPLSIAHGRQAAVGDVLARLLRTQDERVTREYYLNDEGRQIELLGKSVRARYAQILGRPEPFPEDGYHGHYVQDVARAFIKRYGKRFLGLPETAALAPFSNFGMRYLLKEIRRDLERFGLRFERWSSQRWLRTSGRIQECLKSLDEQGALYESEGATWFASTRFGDDKDRVVRKRDGELTYLAPDIAYHRWKFQRGFSEVINLWGPDHHGYISRLKAAVAALGAPAEHLRIRIVQLVTLSRKGKPVRMSKRQGEFVSFRELLDEVGVDATRYFFLMRTMESHLDFDLDLAKSASQDNPVYYVQYAHARICSILAKVPWWRRSRGDLKRLKDDEEMRLIRTLAQYPVVLRLCAQALEPHGLTGYLQRLAESFHFFYTKCRVISEDAPRSAARLALVRAARQVLANGLGVLGVSAPRRM